MDATRQNLVREVLDTLWPDISDRCQSVQPVGGGLSDGLVFRVSAGNDYRLDALPDSWSQASIAFEAFLLSLAEARQHPLVASRHGRCGRPSFRGYRWQLQTWLPGSTVAADDWKAGHSCAAAWGLASLHELHPSRCKDRSLALQRRLRLLEELLKAPRPFGYRRLRVGESTVELPTPGALIGVAREAMVLVDLATNLDLPTNHCWGDAWRGNFLFDGNEVTGLIDFAAATIDTPLLDVARLSGSIPGTAVDRQVAIDAYSQVRPLSETDRQTIAAFDLSGVVLSLANWLRWYEVDLPVTKTPAAAERIQHLVTRILEIEASR